MNTPTPTSTPCTLHAAIPEIMDRFKFDHVQRTMELLNWTWGWTWGNSKTPSIDELKSTAYHVLSGCVNMFIEKGRPKTGMLWATGGFQAMVHVYEGGREELQLVFYVDSASSTGEV